MRKNGLITLEGGEGTGKTTIIEHLRLDLETRGWSVLTTREPGGVAIAEHIREIILDKQHSGMDARTEALLYAAARRQHLVEKVVPALEKGQIVLCDRFIDSSLAYQGYARGLGIDEVLAINQFAIDGLLPDLTVLLDLPPEIGLERIHRHQGREVNRLDLENSEFHHQVRAGYLHLAERFATRIKIVDAAQPLELVIEEVKKIIHYHMNKFD